MLNPLPVKGVRLPVARDVVNFVDGELLVLDDQALPAACLDAAREKLRVVGAAAPCPRNATPVITLRPLFATSPRARQS